MLFVAIENLYMLKYKQNKKWQQLTPKHDFCIKYSFKLILRANW
jgi:hypothetical protein